MGNTQNKNLDKNKKLWYNQDTKQRLEEIRNELENKLDNKRKS